MVGTTGEAAVDAVVETVVDAVAEASATSRIIRKTGWAR